MTGWGLVTPTASQRYEPGGTQISMQRLEQFSSLTEQYNLITSPCGPRRA